MPRRDRDYKPATSFGDALNHSVSDVEKILIRNPFSAGRVFGKEVWCESPILLTNVTDLIRVFLQVPSVGLQL